MAVFPSARRALWRPVRLTWLFAAAVLLATGARDPRLPAASSDERVAFAILLAETSSIAVSMAPDAPVARLTPLDPAHATVPPLAPEQRAALADASSQVVMAAAEAAYEVSQSPATSAPAAVSAQTAAASTVATTNSAPSTTSQSESDTAAPAPDVQAAALQTIRNGRRPASTSRRRTSSSMTPAWSTSMPP